MSAWYIFSALGFYPVFPASARYVLGSPLFERATIHLDNGKRFTVEAVNNKPDNIYIQRVELNGMEYNKAYIEHTDIMKGGTMKILMGKNPNYGFGARAENRP
jgi:putative alpha-1,2-mannosidase